MEMPKMPLFEALEPLFEENHMGQKNIKQSMF